MLWDDNRAGQSVGHPADCGIESQISETAKGSVDVDSKAAIEISNATDEELLI